MNNHWKKYYPLTDKNAFICLVDHMGDDSSIVQAARVSYGKDEQAKSYKEAFEKSEQKAMDIVLGKENRDRQLIRYLLNHGHTTPFEMVEIKFMVQVPMDCWRQWIRHRTASVNEYSTRYTEALDFFQVTSPEEWRLQATDNKQGSSGYLREEGFPLGTFCGQVASRQEKILQEHAMEVYKERIQFGIAKEQARKDLPLSTYTRAYWKCDLHNIFNFLRLRMDSHAQLEIRLYANSMFEIVKQLCPVACEAFEDYVLHAKKFSRMEMAILKQLVNVYENGIAPDEGNYVERHQANAVAELTDREWKEFLGKLS